jgi:two-component system, NarL family, nitrate/nitrite response regulator NarL
MVIRVLVVDQQPGFCRDLEEVLPVVSDDQVRVVASTDQAAFAPVLVRRHVPDVALIDLDLAPPGGLAAIATMRAVQPRLPVLALTERDGAYRPIVDALAAGAQGVLVKEGGAADLVRPMLAAVEGWAVLRPDVLHRLALGRTECPSLTEDQRRLWALIACGSSTVQIARTMHVSERTVKRLTAALLRALGVTNRTEAATLAGRAGLLDGLRGGVDRLPRPRPSAEDLARRSGGGG